MKINVNFSSDMEKIKPMHAVGQPPFAARVSALDFSPMQLLKDACVPYARLHDVGGPYGGGRYVDIPNIFRDFDADVTDPASYDFTFTDKLLEGMAEYGVEPYFRLGVTIENQCNIKAYHIHPPKDYNKWASICEHIIRHYNEGWAEGYHYDIKYWEIWNEPENDANTLTNHMWSGTPEQYYELYDVTAKHLKKCFGDKIKVGGYASCGFYGIFGDPRKYGVDTERRSEPKYNNSIEDHRLNFFFGFMEYLRSHQSPMDFFSWHVYDTVEVAVVEAEFVDRVLNEYGYGHAESHMNEWNLSHDRKKNIASSYSSANVMAMMIGMQSTKTDMIMYYDAKYISVSPYGGFYDPATLEPSCVYYAIKAFGELYNLGTRVECTYSDKGIYALGARSGKRKALVISNIQEDTRVETELTDEFEVYIINKENFMTKTELNPGDFVLEENTIAVIKNY